MKPKSKFLLLDAHALIHRAYHALPTSFVTKKGELVNAVYGFTSVLLKILKEQKPDYVAAAFDTAEPTFRHEEYKEYKAQRPAVALDLVSQIPKIKEILEALDIAVLEAPGFEADDIIATLVQKFSQDTNILIATGDLDTLQLVNETVKVLTFKKGVSDTLVYDISAVSKRFGLEPTQLVDFKALKGDPSDNIPGVAGIGEKTAATLIQQFGSLEKLYQALENSTTNLKDSLKNKLLENKEAAFFSKKLVLLRLDAPVSCQLEDLKFKGFSNHPRLEGLLQELGFFSLFERLVKESSTTPRLETNKGEKRWVKELALEDLTELKKAKELVLTYSLGERDLAELFIAAPKGTTFPVPKKNLDSLKDVLSDKQVKKIGYDLKALWHALQKEGVSLNGLHFDVMLASYVLYPGRRDYPLERIVFQELRKAPTGVLDFGTPSSYLSQIYEQQQKKLQENDLEKVFYEIEMPLVLVLAKMEQWGIKVRSDVLSKLSKDVDQQLKKLESKIYKLAGTSFNINSPSQLSQVLFEKMKIATKGLRKTPGGVISTRASELTKLSGEHPIVDLISEYRELAKLKTTYVDALPLLIDSKTRRLHTRFVQTGTATGRLSSEEPNLQNIPVRSALADDLRKAFVAEKGFKLVLFDYSQIELRLAAALSQDEKMMKAFKEGHDIHALTAAEINNTSLEKVTEEMRQQAKVLNFGVLYGMGPNAFAGAAGVSKERAREFIDEYFKDFAGIAQYLEEIKDEAHRLGFVRTITGRRRYLPEIYSQSQMVRAQAERMAVNMPIQGSDADISKMSMIAIDKEFGHDGEVRMLLQIHDALLFEIADKKLKAAVPQIRQIMENIIKLPVPLKVDVKTGSNWADLKSFTPNLLP